MGPVPIFLQKGLELVKSRLVKAVGALCFFDLTRESSQANTSSLSLFTGLTAKVHVCDFTGMVSSHLASEMYVAFV